MAFFALIAVLLLEQWYPLDAHRTVHTAVSSLASFVERHTNAGERFHAVIAWLLLAGGSALSVLVLHLLFEQFSPLLGWAWDVLVLYLMLGFRRTSHHLYEIQAALREDDLVRASHCLRQWSGEDSVWYGAEATEAEIGNQAIILALITAHRRVFGVLACFLLLPGPAGAVLYRVASILADTWGRDPASASGHFPQVARQFFAGLDWLPARISATAFAVAGDFENAMDCWRNQAKTAETPFWPGSGIVLSSAAGALGVRLFLSGVACRQAEPFGIGCPPDAECLRRTAAMLWRVFLMWLLLAMLIGVAQ